MKAASPQLNPVACGAGKLAEMINDDKNSSFSYADPTLTNRV